MKIGIFGGTFDPVHNGHLSIGIQAINELNLDKLIIVPAKLQPFKLDQKMASDFHRLNMLKLAFERIEKVEISTFELEREEISYTINTLKAYKEIYNSEENEIIFLLGTDSLLKIHLWKEFEAILKNFSIAVGARPGFMEKELIERIKEIKREYGTSINVLSNKMLEISSTEIKSRIKSNDMLNDMVPLEVERYICKNALYR